MRNKKGFTLIELLVVIAIIGLLSTLAVVSLNSARGKARDARRISDVKTIQTALELYKSDNGEQLFATPVAAVGAWAGLTTATLKPYLPAGMPVDPAPSATSFYTICVDGSLTNFIVAAVLEGNPPAPGLDLGVAWDGETCINSNDAVAAPDCDGLLNFCTGSSAPVDAAI
jgi:prepilin-type N-terminal cleavage/methylation domain-containing protein